MSLGFDLCGIARRRSLERQYDRFKNWLADGCDGGLEYLRRNTGQRVRSGGALRRRPFGDRLRRLPPPAVGDEVASRIASYAHTRDYHLTIRERLNELSAYLRELVPGASGRVFYRYRSAGRKVVAVEAGLGWIGRNSLLANPGSARSCCWARWLRRPNWNRTRRSCATGAEPAAPAWTPVRSRRSVPTGRSTRALHFSPDDRSRRRGRRRSARLAVRVRRMPKGPSLQPQSPSLRARLFRTACGTGTVGRRRLVGIGRGRFPADFSAKHRLPGAVCAAYKSG